MLAPLSGQHPLGSAAGLNTFKSRHDLLGGFRLLPEDWLGVPTRATVLPIIAPLSLGTQGIFALLILGHFVRLMLSTLLTESPSGFRDIDHLCSRGVFAVETRDPTSTFLPCSSDILNVCHNKTHTSI